MLDLALKYEDEIRDSLLDTWYDEKYMYYHCSTYHDVYSANEQDGDWNRRSFVSLNKEGNVLGLIEYKINRVHDMAEHLAAINFSNNMITFAKDLIQVVDDIFMRFNIRKLEFSCVIGNPIEKSYDRLVQKVGGNVIGVRHECYKLMNGKYYDEKLYEISREAYWNYKMW